MFTFMRTVMLCTLLGILLSIIFIAPGGVMVGGVNGFLVGVCVGMGERKARKRETSAMWQLK